MENRNETKRRDFLKAVLPVAAVAALRPSAFAAEPKRKPNIIYLMADDQCSYSVGCYGNKDVKTP